MPGQSYWIFWLNITALDVYKRQEDMLELGKRQLLRVVKKVEFGVYLAESAEESEKERVLLPGRQVPEGAEEGTEIEVFLYKDSKDRQMCIRDRAGYSEKGRPAGSRTDGRHMGTYPGNHRGYQGKVYGKSCAHL